MPKRRRFAQRELRLDEFLNRHLTDTAYITTCVRQFLLTLGCDIVCTKGKSTADLRRIWGLNSILRDDEINLKSRDDHRHHSVDALVVALTNRSILQTLAGTRAGRDVEFPALWPGFRGDVESMVSDINVSHRVARRVSGALHEDTIYGPTSKKKISNEIARPHATGWIESEGVFVMRKPVESLTLAMIDEIRDPHVRAIIIERLRSLGVNDHHELAKLPKDWCKEPLFMTGKPGRHSATPNVIKSVRVLRKDQTIQTIRGGTACVKPGNTHHICLFEMPGSTESKPKREMVAVTMMEASHRISRKEPVLRRKHPTDPDAIFLFSLCWGEAVQAEIGGRRGIFVYKSAKSTTHQMSFRFHTDARPSKGAREFTAKLNTLNAVKVTIDLLGRIRYAND